MENNMKEKKIYTAEEAFNESLIYFEGDDLAAEFGSTNTHLKTQRGTYMK
jgi:hypothetical protein